MADPPQVTIVSEIRQRLAELELPSSCAESMYLCFGSDAIAQLHQNPFRVAQKVPRIGFQGADHVAQVLGWELDHSARIEAGVRLVLERAQNDGHCALPRVRLIEGAASLLDLAKSLVEGAIDQLCDQGQLVEDSMEVVDERCEDTQANCKSSTSSDSLVYSQWLWNAESQVANAIARISQIPISPWSIAKYPSGLSHGQISALRAIANSRLVVLTGGPGTGKSTVVRHILDIARHNGTEVMLAAPTGRAAKRLEQATSVSAKTIHRLLEAQGSPLQFGYHEGQPLPPGMLIVDESSMIDMPLAQALLASLTNEHRLVFLGDANQLASVGPGQFLRDLLGALESTTHVTSAQVVRLTEVFRQVEGSAIISHAQRVLRGQPLQENVDRVQEPSTFLGAQFTWIRITSPQRVHDTVVKLVTEQIPRDCGMDPRKDIQVLCPIHGGLAGTNLINRSLQTYFSGSSGVRHDLETNNSAISGLDRPTGYYPGDRVMQICNDYGRGVFNGDIGVVVEVEALCSRVWVDFGDRRLAYVGDELASLQLAYALTIHKSQGNEFPAVVIPLLREHHRMLQRNLLYTAMTRAISRCVIVGDALALRRAILSGDAGNRYSGFHAKLLGALAQTTENSEPARRDKKGM